MIKNLPSPSLDIASSATDPLFVQLTDGTNPYISTNSFLYEGSATQATYVAATPANNRAVPSLIMKGQGLAAFSAGAQTSANSFPVVLASDQAAIPVSGSVTVNVADVSALAVEAGGNLDTIAGDTTSIDAKIPSLVNSSVPVTNIATDIPVAYSGKEYSQNTTSITILYKRALILVATKVITWATAADKTAGNLPASNIVTLTGA